MARARCISCMLWELFVTPASRLLPLIRCPHPHFFPEGTNIQKLSTTNPDLSKDFVGDFSHKMVDFKGQGGSVIVGQRGEGPEVLNIVIFLQLHGGTRRTVPQRGDVKTTNSRNSDEQQQELGNKTPHRNSWPIGVIARTALQLQWKSVIS